MASNNKVIAVPGLESSAAGLMTWWRLDGLVKYDSLRDAASTQGIDDDALPPRVKPQAALRRAMQEQGESRRLVRPLEGRSGYALVDETANEKDLDYSIECKVTFDPDLGMLEVEPSNHPLADEIEASYAKHLRHLSSTDISSWLVKMAGTCNALALRDTGGFYFIPRKDTAKWRKLGVILRECSNHFVSEIQALRTDEAVDAILDALTREAEQEVADIRKALYPEEGEPPGARALRNRASRTESFTDKVAVYEQLLDTKLDKLREQLGELQAELVTATLVAESDAA